MCPKWCNASWPDRRGVAPDPFTHRGSGRSWPVAAVCLLIWAALIATRFGLGASPWILAPIALMTLPALADLVRAPATFLQLDTSGLRWQAGRRNGDIPLNRIDKIRFDTLWDFSIRITLCLTDGRRIRLPPDLRPPHRAFEAALQAHGLTTERHHFAPSGLRPGTRP